VPVAISVVMVMSWMMSVETTMTIV
jgi:hypothetical protein